MGDPSPVGEYDPEYLVMDGTDHALRSQINGPERQDVAKQRRRRKFGAEAAFRLRLINAGGIFAAAAGVAMALSIGLSDDPETETGDAATSGSTSEVVSDGAEAPQFSTLGTQTRISDGGDVRLATPTELGGRTPATARVPDKFDTAAEARDAAKLGSGPTQPELKITALDAEGPASEEVPSLKESADLAGPKLDGMSPAVFVARSNLVWARIFAQAGMNYSAIKRADIASWSDGACGQRRDPSGPTYCALDATLYVPAKMKNTPIALFELANSIADHVHENLGVGFRPASGEGRALRSNCFAGLWARFDTGSQEQLAPATLRDAMAIDGQVMTRWNRDRLAAFETGFSGTQPADCEAVGIAG
ncbi:MAG: neutral zinc metallopeptidase [Pseudomonadota bacterium]